MTTIPSDLVPLPTSPWDVRPAEIPLVIEECRTALWKCRGNVSKAAELLRVSSQRLRTFVDKSEYLQRECLEAKEQMLDQAEDNVFEALTDHQDPGRKDSMTRFVLGQLGQNRGYGTKTGGVNVATGAAKGRITITWDDGEAIVGQPPEDPPTIDVTPRAVNDR
jgi:hypothetical protein